MLSGAAVTLRWRLFLLVAGLAVLLVAAQLWLVRTLAERLDRDVRVVAARVDNLEGPATVEEVLLVREGISAVDVGATLQIENLKDCKRLPRDGEEADRVPLDWTGPGVYLLPLRPRGDGKSFYVVGVPPSPGFPPPKKRPTPRLYPRTDDAVRQVRDMIPQS